MRINVNENSTYRLVSTSLMICLVLLGTVLIRIPIPMTQGYVHLGDAMIFLGVLILGRKQGSAAAALGSALGDILGGFAFWAPWTLVIKFSMAYITGLIIEKSSTGHGEGQVNGCTGPSVLITAMTAGGALMCLGYFIAERIIYGSFALAAVSIPWNVGQFVIGIAVSMAADRCLLRRIGR